MTSHTPKVPRGFASMRKEWTSGKKTLAELSRMVGATPSYLWYIFKGQKVPTKKKRDEMLARWQRRDQ